MQYDRTLVWSSVALRHLLEARLHMLAAVEAMSDMEGVLNEYHRAVDLKDGLDELFVAVEDKTGTLCHRIRDAEQESNSTAH